MKMIALANPPPALARHTSLRAGHDDRAYALVVITAPAE
jgi:hypothetical protein